MPTGTSMFHLCLLVLILRFQEADRPLPNQAGFMEAFHHNLHTPDKLLSQYTYTEKETESKRDSKGKITSTETNVYQVINGAEDWESYQRQIVKKGVPLTPQELEKQDRKEQERVEKERRKRAGWSEAKREQEKAKKDREERETTDDIF